MKYANLTLICAVALLACQEEPAADDGTSETGDPCPAGSEACPCYGNRTCDAGLECLSNLCVDLGLPNTETSGESESGDGDGDGNTGPGDGDGAPGDGDPTGDGDGDTGDGDGETTGGGLRWAAVDQDDQFVGWLTWPPPELVWPHGPDITVNIDQGSPIQIYLTLDDLDPSGEFGFWLDDGGPHELIETAGYGAIRYSEQGCTGVPHVIFGRNSLYALLTEGECANVEALDPTEYTFFYPFKSVFEGWLDTFWGGAEGLVAQSTWYGFDRYLIPREQTWPEILTSRSYYDVSTHDCLEMAPENTCAIRLIETDWDPPQVDTPFKIVELPYSP
jgi:hypothetical protein